MQRGDTVFSNILYVIAGILFLISLIKDKKKTKKALMKTWKTFTNLLPPLLAVFIFVGILLTLVDANTISKLLGANSGSIGTILASVLGSITLMPGFIAFPLAANLLENGAGYVQMAVFISTLMMVGIATLPLEIKYIGKKAALFRNGMSFLYAFVVGGIIGGVII